MTQLRTPLKHALRKTTNEASVARMWARIEARERTGTTAPAFSLPRVWALAAAAIVVLGIAFFALRGARRGDVTAHAPAAVVRVAPSSLGRLARADGAPFVAVHAAAEPASVTLTDGSKIILSAGASVEPRTNDDHQLALQQRRGRVHYDVTPGGPRRWTIACGEGAGATSVEVVGTSFDIDATNAHVRVDVSHGVVVVRGEGVPKGHARLVAGGSIDVATGVHDVRDLRDSDEAPSPAPSPAPTIASSATWKQLAVKGEHGAAYAELGPDGLARATKSAATVDELLALADIARLSGHAGDAVPPLARIVAAHPGDPRASLAALTLGRIELGSLANPHAAVAPLRSALALGIPRDLEGDTHALLVEALGRDGDAAGARAAYAIYVGRHPTHPKRDSVARWVREP
jgi:transmembrane sensor